MKPLIYVADGKIRDINNTLFDTYIRIVDKKERQIGEGTLWPEGEYYTPDEFEAYVNTQRPIGVRIGFDTQEELEYLIDRLSPFVHSLYMHSKSNRAFDLTPLERCSQLESIQFDWNTKQETLWNVKKNTKLKHLELMECYKVSDISALRGSSIEDLRLFGCNGLSSFVSKMHIKDLSVILDMPNLRQLRLDIIKDESSEYYLKLFAKCSDLLTLSMPESFFTFQQYAWLKAHLPNVTSGLECVTYFRDFCSIIGKRTPKNLEDQAKAQKYQKRYDTLVEKYRSREVPPADDEKDR